MEAVVERVTDRGSEPDRTGRGEAEALRARGVERYAAGDLEAAAALWRQALALLPDDIQAQAYVAWVESRIAIEAPGSGQPRSARDVPAAVFSAETVDPIAVLPEETRLASSEVTLTWYPTPAVAVGSAAGAPQGVPPEVAFEGVEAPVRRFLAHAPTRPNLAPMDDVHVLTDERLAELAGWHRPAPPLPLETRAAAVAAPSTMPSGVPAAMPPPSRKVELVELVELEAEPELPSSEGPHDGDAVPRRIIGEPSTRKVQFPFAERVLAARRAIDRGDLESAVGVAEEVVEAAGGLDAPLIAEQVPTLSMIYERVLGRRDRLVSLGTLPPDLDPRSAFLLSRVDGSFSVDDLLDISGMERAEAFRLVAILLRSGALLAG